MYKSFIRPIFFRFDAEKVHDFTFLILGILGKFPFIFWFLSFYYSISNSKLNTKLFGINFPNPVGLAAGLDKNAKLIRQFSSLGFGFIEIGTVTPKPQVGNPKKRLFRLINDNAIINRMGFNNDGIEKIASRLRNKGNVIVGGNIGKNKITPIENAISDYLISFDYLFEFVDYFAVNVSSPNTENLRELQHQDKLKVLLNSIQNNNKSREKPKPILLKIAPDLSKTQLLNIIKIVKETNLDGIIATNTTIERTALKSNSILINQKGGLSGAPLKDRSNEVIRFIYKNSNGSIPIIGVGGIMSPNDALEKIKAGASLVQLYTGFIYSGPTLVKQINKSILNYRLKS
ncbi:MAG: quinone-dependent dihydroorotate dehydrogenase [Flavobacteriaceae bacterium]|nr:quinone-dependent dihydroorotate dehydrogenase [Flavobacteriaceae bacterium]